jgi:RNA polymerase sigma factor (sigma-70 family)
MLSADIFTNEDLLQLWYHGNQNAFGILDQRVRGKLIGRVYRHLPIRLPAKMETAEDLASDIIVKAICTRGRPNARWCPEKGSVLNWLMGILKNGIASFMRTKKGKELLMTDMAPVYEDGESEPFENTIPDHWTGPEQGLVELEQQQRIQDAVQRLSGQDRAILVMRIEERKTLDEIGRKHGLSESTTYRRLRDIGKTIASQVEDVPLHCESLALGDVVE